MLVILSPTKKMLPPLTFPGDTTQARFEKEAYQIVQELRNWSVDEWCTRMKISKNIAEENIQRMRSFRIPHTRKNAYPALFSYTGDAFVKLDPHTLNAEALEFAQQHLRILSGLYGVLRPWDLIQPYRLEMGGRFSVIEGKSPRAFWGERLSSILQKEVETHPYPCLLNLASKEYTEPLRLDQWKARVITPVFKQAKGGRLRTVNVYAKQARGAMARYVLAQGITSPEVLKEVQIEGHRFSPEHATETTWTYLRES